MQRRRPSRVWREAKTVTTECVWPRVEGVVMAELAARQRVKPKLS